MRLNVGKAPFQARAIELRGFSFRLHPVSASGPFVWLELAEDAPADFARRAVLTLSRAELELLRDSATRALDSLDQSKVA